MLNGNRLKNLRKAKGLSQDELGKLLNVTKVSICCYEREKRTPNLETFEDIMKTFNVTADYLLGNDIKVVKEDDEKYTAYFSKEDIELLNEIKSNRNLYNKLLENPKRLVELIAKKLNL
jgi:transcriptional regulator with XRE-family HTH domain